MYVKKLIFFQTNLKYEWHPFVYFALQEHTVLKFSLTKNSMSTIGLANPATTEAELIFEISDSPFKFLDKAKIKYIYVSLLSVKTLNSDHCLKSHIRIALRRVKLWTTIVIFSGQNWYI